MVAETWDGRLNSINLPSVETRHAGEALDAATHGQVTEGSAGGGTGMECYGFKGGNGTASRVVALAGTSYTVGVFLQCNFGARGELVIAGVRMRDLGVQVAPAPAPSAGPRAPDGAGSCIAVVATDAPLTPHQCTALARRVTHGMARTGTTGSHFSGDVFVAFSTGNAGALDSAFPVVADGDAALRTLRLVPWDHMDVLFTAVVQCAEEAVLNALVNNSTMIGQGGRISPALPVDQVRRALMAAGIKDDG